MARQREFEERRPTVAYRQPRTYQQRGPFKGQFQQPAGAQNFRYSNPQLYIVCYLKTFISYYMFYTLHVVEPLRYDSVLIKETNE